MACACRAMSDKTTAALRRSERWLRPTDYSASGLRVWCPCVSRAALMRSLDFSMLDTLIHYQRAWFQASRMICKRKRNTGINENMKRTSRTRILFVLFVQVGPVLPMPPHTKPGFPRSGGQRPWTGILSPTIVSRCIQAVTDTFPDPP